MHIVCPHCHRTNRVPPARLTESPSCGACHEPLLTGEPLALSAAHFAAHIQKSELPGLVDFWAPWCGPCRTMTPVFAQAADALKTRAQLVKVNTEEEQALAAQYNIRSIPTLALFKNGKEVDRVAGALDRARLMAWMGRHL